MSGLSRWFYVVPEHPPVVDRVWIYPCRNGRSRQLKPVAVLERGTEQTWLEFSSDADVGAHASGYLAMDAGLRRTVADAQYCRICLNGPAGEGCADGSCLPPIFHHGFRYMPVGLTSAILNICSSPQVLVDVFKQSSRANHHDRPQT